MPQATEPGGCLEFHREGFCVSTDPARLDLAAVHAFLTRSYWSPGIPRETVACALEHSVCFGLYQGAAQVGLARLVTDRATFAYLADVYVLEEFRGRGLGKWLIACVLAHPDVPKFRRVVLATRDAHRLYEAFGWTALQRPAEMMERRPPGPAPSPSNPPSHGPGPDSTPG